MTNQHNGNGPPIKVEERVPHHQYPVINDGLPDHANNHSISSSRPQEWHADHGLVNDDKTHDLRPGLRRDVS